ncbi:MAG: hypothetical protein IB618_03715 [Candidatus Pacearchaeota archaeon]|nr:MAG: hypothetical protein IB618_03715 [Candidatus Pacearchaeota archaeon]
MKKRKTIVEIICIILILLLVFFLVSGQEGCQLPGQGPKAEKTGIDYQLISGIDYLSAGKLLEQGESFYVGIKIENYDETPRTGQICIRDNIADTFGGISSEGFGECKFFSIRAADVIKKEVSTIWGKQIKEEVTPGATEIYFPEAAEYSYYSLPSLVKPYSGLLFVSLQYRETTQATGTVTVPGPEQPALSQEPAPIAISVVKSIHKRQDGYKVDFEILLKKQQKAKIFSHDFIQENVTYFRAEMVPQTLACTVSGQPITGLVEFENERLIKCSSLIYTTTQQSYPLVITLDYGVALEKSYPFGIETEGE